MRKHLIAALALSFGLGAGSAFAQSEVQNPDNDSGQETPIMGGMPDTWRGDIGDAFYTDNTYTTLRTQEEVGTRFGTLTADQQAQVKSDCANISATNESMTTDPGTTSSITGSVAGSDQASLKELCAWVQ